MQPGNREVLQCDNLGPEAKWDRPVEQFGNEAVCHGLVSKLGIVVVR